jgi:hypothetical protein
MIPTTHLFAKYAGMMIVRLSVLSVWDVAIDFV